jgi:PAS domain S-box-containing protein
LLILDSLEAAVHRQIADANLRLLEEATPRTDSATIPALFYDEPPLATQELKTNRQLLVADAQVPDRQALEQVFQALDAFQGSVSGIKQTVRDSLLKNPQRAILRKRFGQETVQLYRQALDAVSALRNLRLGYLASTLEPQIRLYGTLLIGVLGGLILLACVLVILLALQLVRLIEAPWVELAGRLNPSLKLPADSTPVGKIGAYLNARHLELAALKQFTSQIATGNSQPDLPEDKLDGNTFSHLVAIRKTIVGTQDELKRLKFELTEAKRKAEELETTTKTEKAETQGVLQSILQPFVYFETNTSGQILTANTRTLQVTGCSLNDIRRQKFYTLPASFASEQLSKEVSEQLLKGEAWTGEVVLTPTGQPATHLKLVAIPLKTREGIVDKFVFTGTDISSNKEIENRSVVEVDRLTQELTTLRQDFTLITLEKEELATEVQHLKAELGKAQQDTAEYTQALKNSRLEQELLRKALDVQKELEHRLYQQQAALQELTRNSDLKAGNVREALRVLTETVAYAVEDERVGIWFLTDNGASVRCLDLYDRTLLHHEENLSLYQRDLGRFFEAIQQQRILAIEDARTDELTTELTTHYLAARDIHALLLAQIHLGGVVVGFLLVESIAKKRNWKMDEQNFLLSVADVISLALEQGNRKTMEEELRLTLEEAQALEEELRQNAEEIEASNEEMRRTQIELRGQISALNNAAIVSETNLEGRIIYANAEFISTYKFNKKEILGLNHNAIQSNEHPPEFFRVLWQTITQGQVWRGELKNKTKDNTFVWVALTITPVLDLQGDPYKYIGVSFDITSRIIQERQIKEALEVALAQEELLKSSAMELQAKNQEMLQTQVELAGQLRALNVSAMVYETDVDDTIIYANDELCRVSGFDREEIVGQGLAFLRSGFQAESLLQRQTAAMRLGKIWRGELEKRTKDGRTFWVLETNTPVFDPSGDVVKFINVLIDITEQKNSEFRLKRQQTAIADLNNETAVKEGNVKEALNIIARIGAETLGVERAAIWVYIENRAKVRCNTVVQEETHMHEVGTVIDTELYPNYFKTLDEERVIAASDAANDPRTKELAFTFLKPSNIASILDASVRSGGKTVAILSFEQRRRQRDWTLDEQSFAMVLADMIASVMEHKERNLMSRLKGAYAQLEEANKEVIRQKAELEETNNWLKESIKYAKRIQNNILPSKEQISEHFDQHFIIYRPKDIVGGDFYFFTAIGTKKVMIVADGTGHGVPGAFLTMIGYLLLNQIINQMGITRPAEILNNLHKGVRATLKQDEEESTSRDGMDIAVVVYNADTGVAEYAGANLPFYYYQDWEVHEVKADKKSIGGEQLEEERIFTNHEIKLKPGDAFYLFTDGFVDQLGGPDDKRFSTRRFRDLIMRTQHESPNTQRALLNLEWKDWKEDREQLDDITVVGVKL